MGKELFIKILIKTNNFYYFFTRIASLYNIPFATNRTTADMILTSSLFDNKDYHRIIPKYIEDYNNRKL